MTGFPDLPPIREVTQTVLADSDVPGLYGNCVQAALASALGLELEVVPHFAQFTWWDIAVRLWLRGRSMDWESQEGNAVPNGRSIVAGMSPRDTEHAVVGEGGKIVWDPHPSRAGLTVVTNYYLLVRWPDPGKDRICLFCRQPV